MQFTHRQLQVPRLARQLAVIVGLGVFFAIAGPFGTYGDFSVAGRYAYWIGLCLVGYVSIAMSAHALLALDMHERAWALLAVAVGSSVPTTLAVAWVESVTRLGKPVPLIVMPRVFMAVLAIQVVVLLFLTRMKLSVAPLLLFADEPEPPAPVSSFHQRIPPHLGIELLAIESEDHYLRVITTQGSDLILMRLGDALRELEPSDGMQVHRSWWVAHAAVTGSRRDDGKFMLVLSNGQAVPVSRTYMAAVRAAMPGLKPG